MFLITFHFFLFLTIIYLNGFFFLKKINNKLIINNFFEISFVGLIISLLSAQLLNFFFPLNDFVIYFNIIILIFLSFLNKMKFNELKLDKITFIIPLLISLINIFGSNFSDDLNHYHYSYILNTDKTNYIWGLGYLHSHYGLSPIWLIGQSYFNFDFSRLQDIHILNGLMLFLFLGIFFSQIKKSNLIKKNIYQPIFFSLLIFVLLKYTRLKEFGIDRPAYLIFYISIFYYFKYLSESNNKKFNDHFFIFCLILLTIFFIKVIFIFLLLIPIFMFYKRNLEFKFFDKKYLLLLFFLLCYTLKNILISGCVIYPSALSCINIIPWSNITGATDLTESIEIFNKSFFLYDGRLSAIEYIKDFNWINTWLIRHKIELIEILSTILVVISLTFLSFKFKKNENRNKYLIEFSTALWIVLFFSLLIFVLKNPNIRMNHHVLIIFMILLISYLVRFYIFSINKKFFISIIILSISFNFLKNFNRVHELNYKNDVKKNLVHKIYKAKKFNIDNFEYYVGWYGNAPIGNTVIKNKKFKKFSIFKIIY